MKKYTDILKEIKKARAAITDTAKTENDLARLSFVEARRNASEAEQEEARAQYNATRERYEKECQQNETQKIKIEILKDNAAQALFSEIINPVCEIWNKYEGKPHGEKTAQKIREEIKTATGYRVSIYNRYDDAYITVYFDYEQRAPFNSLSFVPIWTGEKQPALIDNKVVKIRAEKMRVYCGSEYVENVNAHIKALKKAHAAAIKAEKAFENAISEYNRLTRGNIQQASQREGVKKWFI